MAGSRMMIEDYAGVTVVTFSDTSILDSATIDQIGRDLYPLADAQNRRKLVLDFSNVKFLSSQALGILITFQKKVAAIQGTLVLCGLRPELMKIFTITSLDRLFQFFPEDAAALKSFGVNVQ
jgi:anti-sigma B factor antagonist